MNTSIRIVLSTLVSGLLLGGCVSSGTYQAKELESQQLSRKLDETKTSYGELKEKFGKLEEVNNEQAGKLNRLASESAELKQEITRLTMTNGEQNATLRKSSAEAEEMRLENARLAETISKQSENLKTISAEFVELKLENAKLVESLQPENIMKTVGDIIATQKQKIKTLTDENSRLKVKLVTQPAAQSAASRPDKAPVDKVQKPAPPPAPAIKEFKAEPAVKESVDKSPKPVPQLVPATKELHAEPVVESPAAPAPAGAKPELTPEPAENDSVTGDGGSSGQAAAPQK